MHWWIKIIALIALLQVLNACNGPRYQKQESGDTQSAARAVRVAKPESADLVELGAPLSGTIRAKGQVSLGFQVSGAVSQILVEQGDVVKEGQVLAKLDARPYAAQRDQAAGALAMAQAALSLANEGTRIEDISAAEAQLASAQTSMDLASADQERARTLFAEGVISKQQLDRAESGYSQAVAGVKSAAEMLEKAQAGPRQQEIDQAKAAAGQAGGALRAAQTQLDYATLTAPTAGTIVSRTIELGSTVSAGMPVLGIADLGELIVRTEIPEGDLLEVAVGDGVAVTFPAHPGNNGLVAKGVLSWVSPSAQMATRGFPVEVRLIDPKAEIVPGMVALVKFDYMRSPGGVVIQHRSVIDSQVFVVEDGKARLKPVSVLLDKGERVFVSGLSTDDQVVINGQAYLSEGEAVVIVDALGIEEITKLEAN